MLFTSRNFDIRNSLLRFEQNSHWLRCLYLLSWKDARLLMIDNLQCKNFRRTDR